MDTYGIDGENVVLIETLQSEHLDFNEFQASLEALLLASTQNYQKLKVFRDEHRNQIDSK